MKKLLLIFAILFVAVSTTACINNLAVQELNNKASIYEQKGQYEEAIKRLESSIDLDPTIVETHYNLGIAYSNINEYDKAILEFNKVIDLDSNFADVYYSLATTENNFAIALNKKEISLDNDKTIIPSNNNQDLTENEKTYIEELFNSAVENYNKYLSLKPNAKNKEQIEKEINSIKDR